MTTVDDYRELKRVFCFNIGVIQSIQDAVESLDTDRLEDTKLELINGARLCDKIKRQKIKIAEFEARMAQIDRRFSEQKQRAKA